MAVRTHAQLARARRIEAGIRLAAPLLDLVLFAGGQLSRIAGRRELRAEPAPPALESPAVARRRRRLAAGSRG